MYQTFFDILNIQIIEGFIMKLQNSNVSAINTNIRSSALSNTDLINILLFFLILFEEEIDNHLYSIPIFCYLLRGISRELLYNSIIKEYVLKHQSRNDSATNTDIIISTFSSNDYKNQILHCLNTNSFILSLCLNLLHHTASRGIRL